MNANLAALLYLVAGILFILALRGLSSPATSRQGNRFGMIGMAIAVLTTLALKPPSGAVSWLLVILGFAIGGGDRRLARPHHPDDGDAAARGDVPLAGRPRRGAGRGRRALRAGGLRHRRGRCDIHPASIIEMSLGLAIGAITFTGSIIAFLKLDGRMSGTPILLPQRHVDQHRPRRRARRADRALLRHAGGRPASG